MAILLLGSAALRLGIEVGPALAREAAVEAAAETDARPGGTADPLSASDLAAPDETDLERVLRALQRKEAVLQAREREMEDRAKALEVAEAALQEQLAALVEAEQNLASTIAVADGASEEDVSRLTSVYEQMKPKESAALFEAMDPAFAAGFLGRMRPDAAAGILARLSPDAAYSISVILAGRNALAPTE